MPRVLAASSLVDLLGDFDRAPAYLGLARSVRVLLTDGRVPVGTRLPSERELTAALDVSRTTVARAYAELREQGYLVSRQGSGSVVALPDLPGHRGDHLLRPADHADGATDLTCAAPLPPPGLLAAYQRAVEALPGYLAGTGYHPSGLPVLREAIAASYAARGLPTTPEQIVVVPGALAGVAAAVGALLSHGNRTVLESPTYPNAIAALTISGARLSGVDVPPDAAERGVDTAGLATAIRQLAPTVAYLVPDFHNPTAALMDDDARERIAHALRRAGTTAIVDESMQALALDGQAMPRPFAAHAPDTITVGSISKSHWGGVRVGWLRAPQEQVDTMFRARLRVDLGVAPLEQLVAADLLTGEEQVAHRREQLRESRDAAYAAIAEHLPTWRVSRPAGGLSLWCELPAALSTALLPRAARHGVLLASGPSFAPHGGLDRFLRIPYALPANVMTAAVVRLAAAWEETVADPHPSPHPPRHRARTAPLVA